MKQKFKGWQVVADHLKNQAAAPGDWLNLGQRASLRAIAERLPSNGIILADEVGMGKTRIAVSLVNAVVASGGRVALLVPPGLGFQWQDELSNGGLDDAPSILRSLLSYFKAWKEESNSPPWFDKSVVMLSHAFSNWRLGENTYSWRWELLPMLYARSRKNQTGRWPRGFHPTENDQWDEWVDAAARNICENIPMAGNSPARKLLEQINSETPWPGALDSGEYSRNAALRPLLEKAVGLGLGVFDLVIIDEAHKSRGTESSLSRLLENIILMSGNARRLAMTATPVELDVTQWQHMLKRIGVGNTATIDAKIENYAEAVRHVRQCWRSNDDARKAYEIAAAEFQKSLSRYLLRRDKREDDAVSFFMKKTGKSHDAYRQEKEIIIRQDALSPAWRQGICVAEALSLVASQYNNSTAKRLRLTIGNGHGVSTILDQLNLDDEEDAMQEECDRETADDAAKENELDPVRNSKREERTKWWLNVMESALVSADEGASLYEHPAILAAVSAIEEYTNRDEKVLVFGRFNRPLLALTELLNARAILRALDSGAPWPQTMLQDNEWKAVQAAQKQMRLKNNYCRLTIDQHLDKQYKKLEKQREGTREDLFDRISAGLKILQSRGRVLSNESALFEAARKSTHTDIKAFLARALEDLTEDAGSADPSQWAKAFVDLMGSLRARNEGDANGDAKLDEGEACKLWLILEERIEDEYSARRGTFARLMNGNTQQSTRRLLQLSFNRARSFPKVLVAQSVVGREGLNLHLACRVVVLLHPEWNPGIVEQQIGRVDRVGSRWAKEMEKSDGQTNPIPRIEIRPVVFQGTYDEHNWRVLRERWDDLRTQLHGVIVPARERTNDETNEHIEWLDQAAPNFSPLSR